MSFLTEEMRAQLMKVVGVNKEDFESLMEKHAPEIAKNQEALEKTSPFDIQRALFKNQLLPEEIDQLNKMKSVPEKIKYIFGKLMTDQDFVNIRNILPEPKKTKNTPSWKKYKDLGNQDFQSRNYDDAIKNYNESVRSGELVEGNEVALSIANRSVVHFNLKDYQSCLHDCKAAIHFGYPADLRYKVLERQARSYKALGQHVEARKCFEDAIANLSNSRLTMEKKKEVEVEIKKVLESLPESDEVLEDDNTEQFPLRLVNTHSQLPCLTESADVKYNKVQGRYIVAKEKIRPGEMILVEEPLTWTLNPLMSGETCLYCINSAKKTLIPSSLNESAVLCCLDCFQTEHPAMPEARILDPLRIDQAALPLSYRYQETDHRIRDLFAVGKETAATTLLAYWCIKREPVKFFVQNETEAFTGIKPDFGVKEKNDWKLEGAVQNYKSLYNAVSHAEGRSADAELDLIITTAVLIRFLQETNYFSKPCSSDENLTREEVLVGRIIYQLQAVIKYNQHALYQVEKKIEAGKNLNLVDSGTAVYPTLLLFNHSCAPNTLRINRGNKVYVIAKSEILPGEEISDCYGIHHLNMAREERLVKLCHFKFDCTCQACKNDHPLFPRLSGDLSQSQMGQLGSKLSQYQKKFRAGCLTTAASCCQEYLESLAALRIQQPHRNYEIAGLALASCFWSAVE